MLPDNYQWLEKEPGPKMIVEGLKLFGTLETPGPQSNPTIIAWAREVGLFHTYSTDSVPWCGLFMALVAKRAGKEIPKSPLWALNWAKFGFHVDHPMLGDVLVFLRNGGGHVTLYVAEDDKHFHCLGGNQSDAVTITRIEKSRLYDSRRPLYKNQPSNVRRIFMDANGPVSTNEG